ncbi:MAG: polysaccharide deacetylase family protein [Verrucomicrobia bacterium]|nr:MAG: polysaccharide deacetylase family protein [Verrucomicrobiota bacterium]
MLIRRSFIFVVCCSLPLFALRAADAAPAGKKEKPAPTEAVDPGVTFDWVHVDGPYIAMTFDDGPSAKLTPKLLDLLAQHHIKATFFLIGQNAAENPELVAREAREGHEVANHSWSHPNLAKMSEDGVRGQLRKTDDAIKNGMGKSPTLMRPPYGSITPHQKKWIHQEFGYKVVLWDVDPLDWRRPGPSAVCNRIVKNTRAGSIILAHDIHPGTIEAIPCVFKELEAKGFKFVTVSELIAMQTPIPPKPSPSPKSSPTAKSAGSPKSQPATSISPTPTAQQ